MSGSRETLVDSLKPSIKESWRFLLGGFGMPNFQGMFKKFPSEIPIGDFLREVSEG